MKRIGIFGLILSACILLLLCSCGDGKKSGGDAVTDGQLPLETVGEENAIDLSEYVIIRSDSSPEIETDAAVALRMEIQEKCGYLPAIKTDFVGRGKLEIVIGETKRGGTDGLNKSEFIIKHDGNGFLIAGGSDVATVAAVRFFSEHLLSHSGALCKQDFEYRADNSFRIGDKTYDEAKISVGFKGDSCSAVMQDAFSKLGVPSSVGHDAMDANIVLTSDEDIKLSAVEKGSWGVLVENGILYVVARDEYDMASACRYVSELFAGHIGKFVFDEGVLKVDKKISKEEFYARTNLTVYPEFPERIGRDYMYSVTVTQGDKTASLPVYDHCQDNPRYIRDNVGGDNYRRFSMFAFSGGQVRVDVKVGRDFESYCIIPAAKGIKSEYKDGVISIYLDKPEYCVLRLDDDSNTNLSILADYPEYPLDIPSRDDPNVTWISGVREAEEGITVVKENSHTVYIEAGAVFFSRIKLEGNNCRILGRGAMVDPFENFYKFNPAGQTEASGVKFVQLAGASCLFDGPVLLDAHCYNFNVRNGGTVRNGKALSTMITTDGLQLVTDCTAERCFVYVGDNGTVFSGENVRYKDITIGTSCAAIFPQGETGNCKMEDIYVFRSDGGLINNRYNFGGATPKDSLHHVDITGLYADDCVYLPWFFQGKNMGTLEKVFNITNATSCSTRGVEGYYSQPYTGSFIKFETTEGDIFTDNYTLNLKNLYIDGRRIEYLEDIGIYTSADGKNTVNLEYDGTEIITRKNISVEYKSPLNVYIGRLQIFTKEPAVINGDKVYLPSCIIEDHWNDELLASAGQNGYIDADQLIRFDLAEKYEIVGNDIIITPKEDLGRNLLSHDKGDIPNYIEAVAYKVDMTAVEMPTGYIVPYSVYSLFNIASSGAGITRDLTDIVKMYGGGRYVLEFQIKGEGNGEVRYYTETSDKTSNQKLNFTLDGHWKTVRFETAVSSDLSDLKAFTFKVASADDTLRAFDIKFIEFKKID